jgi:hypothetical protein
MPGASARFPGFRRRLRASVAHSLDVPFDQKASISGFEFMGFMPARASPSRPLVSVAFGSLPTPRRFAVPCGPPLKRAAFPRGPLCPTKPRKVHGFQTETKGTSHEQDNHPPSHRVYAVTKNGERSFWQPIGAAWVHSDGWGFNVKLDYGRFERSSAPTLNICRSRTLRSFGRRRSVRISGSLASRSSHNWRGARSDHRRLTMVCRLLPGTDLLHTVPSAESCAFERQPMKRRRNSGPKEMAG